MRSPDAATVGLYSVIGHAIWTLRRLQLAQQRGLKALAHAQQNYNETK